MRYFSFFLLALFLISCNPFSLDDDGRDRDRSDRDRDRRSDFRLPEIEELDLEDVKDKLSSRECYKYKGSVTPSLLDGVDLSPTKPLRNCIAYGIDKGLAPLCRYERELKEERAHWKNRGDEETVEEIDLLLEQNEEEKYEFADYLYTLADEVDNLQAVTEEEIDKHDEEEDNSLGNRLGNSLIRLGVRSEIGSITRTVDARAHRVCSGRLDLDRIKARRRRR